MEYPWDLPMSSPQLHYSRGMKKGETRVRKKSKKTLQLILAAAGCNKAWKTWAVFWSRSHFPHSMIPMLHHIPRSAWGEGRSQRWSASIPASGVSCTQGMIAPFPPTNVIQPSVNTLVATCFPCSPTCIITII